MTTLLLSVTRGPSAFLNQTRAVSSGAFQIGRAQPSDWVLEDPARVMSKRHCVFRQDERGWSVADVSRNGSFLARGGETMRLGPQPHRLEPGEKLRFGEYELAVDLREDEASFMRIPLPPSRAARLSPDGIAAMPPDVPPRSYPRAQRARPQREEDAEPTRFVLHRQPAPGGGLGGGLAGGLAGDPAGDPAGGPAASQPMAQAGSQSGSQMGGQMGGQAGSQGRGQGHSQGHNQDNSYGNGRSRDPHGLAALLDGAGLAASELQAVRESDALRAAGAMLRAAASGTRDLRFATLGEADLNVVKRAPGSSEARALPLVAARTDAEALARLLSGTGETGPAAAAAPAAAAVEAAFEEIRQHHDWLVRAARRSLRTMLEGFDPDAPRRQMVPHWLDMLPGWRRWRGAVLARRRYRRLMNNPEQTVDRALAAAYWDVRRETEARWQPR